jgi:hypothetical protein
MIDVVKVTNIEDKIQVIRNQKVIIDSDVAKLYDVETKRINEAVKNNPDKFPYGYVFELSESEFADLRSKISTANLSKVRTMPKAFTEKGLYMLATILKSQVATETTINIIETFTKTRELSRTVGELVTISEETKQKSLLKRSGELISEVLTEALDASETETSIEINLAVLKIKHTIKHKNGNNEVREPEPIYITLQNKDLNGFLEET